jgi:hypothetical protein
VDVWSVYGIGLGRVGRVDLSGRFAYDSALTYSFRAAGQPLSALQRARIAAYVSQPTGQTIYFGPRGAGSFEDYGRFSMAVTYSVPVLRRARPWVKLELYNVFNNDKLVTWNTTVRADNQSPLDELGLPTGYIKSPLFGQAQSNGNYLAPREVLGGELLLCQTFEECVQRLSVEDERPAVIRPRQLVAA